MKEIYSSHCFIRKTQWIILLLIGFLTTVPGMLAQTLYVGDSTSGNSTNFSSGTNGYSLIVVGNNNGSSNNSITVDGVGTELSSSGELRVGYYGSSNAVLVSNGASVTVGGWTLVGEWSGADLTPLDGTVEK
jgi:hypothetical protein